MATGSAFALSSSSPCAACKFLRRKCTSECVFAPYFPADNPQRFAHVHKVFGASNVSKMLNDIPAAQREDAASSLAYEAEARMKDPVYGCVGTISLLQRHVAGLQRELALAQSHLSLFQPAHGLSAHAPAQHPLLLQPSTVHPGASPTLHGPAAAHHQLLLPHHQYHHHHHPQHMSNMAADVVTGPLALLASSSRGGAASSHRDHADHAPDAGAGSSSCHNNIGYSASCHRHESTNSSSCSPTPLSAHTSATTNAAATLSGINMGANAIARGGSNSASSQPATSGVFNTMGYFKLEP